MINGVVVKKLISHPDIPDRIGEPSGGFLIEVLRNDDDLLKKFGQSTMSLTQSGTIKAFHWHKKQDDLWFIATGQAKIVLYDKRNDSVTFGQTDVIMAGQDDYKLVLIPKGVAHGYQAMSKDPVILLYHTTESYDPNNPDEERIAWDDPEIGFNWT